MSNDLKIKDINNKLAAKLSTSTWGEFLVPYVGGVAHRSFMQQILSDMESGVKFTPPMKNWFDEFFRVSLESMKAVVIIDTDTELPFTLDEDTFKLVINRTDSDDESNINAHGKLWKFFNELFVEFVAERGNHIPFIFVNPVTYPLANNIPTGTYKFFLPESSSEFWKEEVHKAKTLRNINKVLSKGGKKEIIW
jgi:uracil DNA glycosylase